MLNEIERLVDEQIRPKLQLAGGDIKVLEISEDKFLCVGLYGACSNCPAQQQTIQNLLEELLLDKFPELAGINIKRQVNKELLAQALDIIRGKVTL